MMSAETAVAIHLLTHKELEISDLIQMTEETIATGIGVGAEREAPTGVEMLNGEEEGVTIQDKVLLVTTMTTDMIGLVDIIMTTG